MKVRVHELAKEFGTSPAAILRLLQGRGFFVRSASSAVDRYAVEWLRFEFTVDQPLPNALTAQSAPRTSVVDAAASRRSRPDDQGSRSLRRRLSVPVARPAQRQPRSIRSVAVYGVNPAETATLSLPAIHQGLRGCPYSLPDEQTDYLVSTFLPRVAALSIRARRAAQLEAAERKAVVRRATRSTEIYESNRIENLGPDLSTTDRLLHEHELHRSGDVSIAEAAIQRCLTAEPKVREVVGLGAARLLAEIYCREPDRHLTASDIRQLHELILVGDPRRGRYKGYLNKIEGSTHVPTAPSDTPAAMSSLTNWLATTSLAPLWRAAVAHAWLAHIHPFDDGNGRVARLLANLVLIRAGMPPLIVRASADRGAYLDALGTSDAGGDILPLARVFRRILSRAVEDLQDPNLGLQFEARLEQRASPTHVTWNNMLTDFLSELAPQLLLHRLHLYLIGEVTDAELLRIGSGRPENAWIAKVNAGAGARDLLLHVAAPTTANRRYIRSKQITPSIFVSVRNPRPLDARLYYPVGGTSFTYEFTPLIESNIMLLRRGATRTRLPVPEAADAAADHLARAHRQLIGRQL